jgi:PadR family transcriptional regulator PadR
VSAAEAFERVARVLLDDPAGRHFGYETFRAAGVRSRRGYPILHRLLEEDWATDGWEDEALCRGQRRSPRRFYVLTDVGRARLGELVAEADR